MPKNHQSSSPVPRPGTISKKDVYGEQLCVESRYTPAPSRVGEKGRLPSQNEEKLQTPDKDVESQIQVVVRHDSALNACKKNCSYFTPGIIISAAVFFIFMAIAIMIVILIIALRS